MNPNLQWFAIRVTYGREIKLKDYLNSLNIRSFIPMHYTEKIKNGQKQKEIVPVVRNLIFIHSTRQALDEIKQRVSYKIPIRYIINKENKQPIVVRDVEMNYFIAACGTMDERLIFISRIGPTLQRGTLVRVTGGIFNGIEGRVVRIKKDRRVMVSINGLISVITAFIDPLLLEPVEKMKMTE